ncbi:MAG: hypothetical protein II970_06985 [Paludibacteraceae bacterium]|nr:hypothetical protein [Paludibacteraceae bacterium]
MKGKSNRVDSATTAKKILKNRKAKCKQKAGICDILSIAEHAASPEPGHKIARHTRQRMHEKRGCGTRKASNCAKMQTKVPNRAGKRQQTAGEMYICRGKEKIR